MTQDEQELMAQDASASAEVPFTTMMPFKFGGAGGEYFGIWFVNIFLTVVTFGIYSAWAKVRNLRYFYRHTSVADAHFDYHADPLVILKGRIIAVFVFVVYSILSELHVAAAIGLTLLLMIAIPWVIVRSLKFRFTNTSYRNIRMGFDGDYVGVLKEFILFPLLVVPTLGVLWPYIRYRQSRYLVNNLRFGTSKFLFSGSWVPWFKAGLPLVLIAVFGLLGPGVYLAIKLSGATTVGEPSEEFPEGEPAFDADAFDDSGIGSMMGLFGLAVLLFYVALPYYIVTTRNLLFEASALGQHGFESTMRTLKYVLLVIACFFIVGASFGLGTPWAKVILMRYKTETLQLAAHGQLDQFLAREQEQVRAFGEELGEAFDIDVGL